MPEGALAVPAPARPAVPENSISQWISTFARIALIYYAFSWFRGQAAPPTPSTSNMVKDFLPLWNLGTKLDLSVYIHTQETPFLQFNDKTPIWKLDHYPYGDYQSDHTRHLQIPTTAELRHNGSLFAHICVCHSGSSCGSGHSGLDTFLYIVKPLVRFMPKRKVLKTKKLVLANEQDSKEMNIDPIKSEDIINASTDADLIVSYWWPNITLNLVPNSNNLPKDNQPVIAQMVKLSPDLKYYPLLYYNDFWMLGDQLQPINVTVTMLNLTVTFYEIAMWKMQFYAQFTESFKMQTTMMGAAQSENDEMKRMFLETNPILLGVTMLVSLLHSVFDFLAFKNDIEFWNKRKTMEGLSLRSILLNIVFQVIIFLYLLDNDTSWMILISSGIGLLIEVWKVQKTVIVTLNINQGFPWIQFTDRVKPTKRVSITKKYDQIAFTYLSYAMYPLLFGYAIYSLVYQEHKSWYSYIVGTLVGFVYAFGFITMTPQLFINYKLKSVAHMPWKTFLYKALNTFIDDLFAFVIKMPWLHRIACLRDDVVFLVYLYQKWIYKEDKRRRNEFGQVGEVGEDDEEDDEIEVEPPVLVLDDATVKPETKKTK